jgi:divinyl chlorophyllide a 8-vinyl-reductase
MTPDTGLRVLLLGATGTIGQATAQALRRQGHAVVCLVRPRSGVGGRFDPSCAATRLPGCTVRTGDPTQAASIVGDGMAGERFDAVVSCMASRTGAPADARAIDLDATLQAIRAAQDAGVPQMVLLSALCVQKPLLAFQQAKRAAEQALMVSGLGYSIVRPTAFFKSLSGQVERVRRGQPFLLMGDGTLTACKPISDRDLGDYIAGCLTDPARQGRVLPIGGPGPAITPREQGERLFSLLGLTPRFRQVPVAVLDAVIGALRAASFLRPSLAEKAELARIGRYYATESMLVWDAAGHRYDEAATPSTGSDTLWDHYAALARGEALPERGDHAVF